MDNNIKIHIMHFTNAYMRLRGRLGIGISKEEYLWSKEGYLYVIEVNGKQL